MSLTPLYTYYHFIEFFKIFIKNNHYDSNKLFVVNQILTPPIIISITLTTVARTKFFKLNQTIIIFFMLIIIIIFKG